MNFRGLAREAIYDEANAYDDAREKSRTYHPLCTQCQHIISQRLVIFYCLFTLSSATGILVFRVMTFFLEYTRVMIVNQLHRFYGPNFLLP